MSEAKNIITSTEAIENDAEAWLRELAVARADLKCRQDIAVRCFVDEHVSNGVILRGSKVLTWYERTEKVVTEHRDGKLVCMSATVSYDLIADKVTAYAGKWPKRVKQNVTINLKETDLTKTNNLRDQPNDK